MAVLLTLTSCLTPREPPSNLPTTEPSPLSTSPKSSPEVEMSVRQLIVQLPFKEKEKRAGMLQAWDRVPDSDHFRVGNKSDFENPFHTYDYGEIAGAYGLALLIVNKTMPSVQRVSLVIFIERPANRYDIYWIYRDMDLSKYRMSRASGDIFVDEVRKDGTRGVCQIQWSKKQREWTCQSP
jgi:hypothetical protein